MTLRTSNYHRLDSFVRQQSHTSIPTYSASQRTFETQSLTRSSTQPDSTDFTRSKSRWRKPQRATALWSLGVFTIILANCTLLGWALKKFGTTDLIVKLQQGSCSEANRVNTWVHLAINLLSTVILSGSNYCMQCLVAPTRGQINKAHAKREWLDIGIPSWRNLISLSRKRQAMWWALGVSSIPIHLLLNSAFFVTLSSNGYNVLVTTEAFLQGAPFDDSFSPLNGTSWDGWTPNSRLWHYDSVPWQQYVGRLKYDGKSYPLYSELMVPFNPHDLQQTLLSDTRFEELDNESCITAYSVDLLTDRRNLVLVSANSSLSGSSILYGGSSQYLSMADPEPESGLDYNPYAWICSDLRIPIHTGTTVRADQSCFNYVRELSASPNTWSPWTYNIERCLSERVPENCSFSMNLLILITVLLCNLAKLICMLSFALRDLDDHILTLGDGIHSFLEEPDPGQECLRLVHDPESTTNKGWTTSNDSFEINYPAPQKISRHNIASRRQWKIFCVLSSLAIVSVSGFLWLAISVQAPNVSIWSLGIGKVNVQSLIHGWLLDKFNGTAHSTAAIIASVLVANTPQLILSAIYLSLNNLCTSIACGTEWNRLNIEAKGLRVSSTPQGKQRDTYFLSLPYALSLPMIISMALLHWLISQSIFLAVVAVFDPNGTLKNPIATATCGFSPVGMICTLVIGSFGFGAMVLYGRQKIQYNMPLVQTNSSGIAAACRVPRGHESIDPTKLILWSHYEGHFFGPGNVE